MTAIELQNPQYNDTHGIKPDIPKEKREAMTEEQRNAIPFIGNLRPIEPKPQATMQVNSSIGVDAFEPNNDDLPF